MFCISVKIHSQELKVVVKDIIFLSEIYHFMFHLSPTFKNQKDPKVFHVRDIRQAPNCGVCVCVCACDPYCDSGKKKKLTNNF